MTAPAIDGLRLAARTGRVPASPTLGVFLEAERLRRQGVDVVDFGAGEPDFPTPAHVKAAGVRAIEEDYTRYTAVAGDAALRAAIAARYRADYGVAYDESEIIVTAGGKQALFNAVLALCQAGDEVITHVPGWPTLVEQIKLAEAEPVLVRTEPEDGFRLHADRIAAALTPRTRAVIINSPCNPTGAVVSEPDLIDIVDATAGRGIWLILDLCYEKLLYDPVAHNLPKVLDARARDRAVLAGSASKAYAMTGWRCGWAIGPAPVIAACNALQSHVTSNAASISQRAALAALTGSQEPVGQMLAEYRRRRDALHACLTADPGITCVKPAGAFYLFPRVTGLLDGDRLRSSADVARALLEESHVALAAGEGFHAPGFLRLSYATSMARVREGGDRIRAFAERHRARSGPGGATA